MTVVVYRRGNKTQTLVSDCQATNNRSKRKVEKIWQLEDGTVVATCGLLPGGLIMRDWIKAGENLANYPEIQATEDWSHIIVMRAGQVPYEYEQVPIQSPITDEFRAWGIGKECALGALHVGADAFTAVEAANAHIEGCGFGSIGFNVKA